MSGDTPDPRRNLGRGLAALFGEEKDDYAELDKVRQPRSVPVGRLRPGPSQPRRNFREEDLAALVDSVREKGVLQPILVRRVAGPEEFYEIVAGERRWRAAQQAQLHDVPVLVRELDDAEALEIALVENIQRQDLTPIEEAEGYRRLMEEFTHSQGDLARAVGKSRPHVANMMRLLSLPEPVKMMVDERLLSAGHARALLNASDPLDLAQDVVKRGLSVRETERLAARSRRDPKSTSKSDRPVKDPDTISLERDLSALLGLKVTITLKGSGGELAIHYRTLEQLDEVLHRLKRPPG
jgi:ParB family chromosome partitioning protein